jgi:hypothetical protein
MKDELVRNVQGKPSDTCPLESSRLHVQEPGERSESKLSPPPRRLPRQGFQRKAQPSQSQQSKNKNENNKCVWDAKSRRTKPYPPTQRNTQTRAQDAENAQVHMLPSYRVDCTGVCEWDASRKANGASETR